MPFLRYPLSVWGNFSIPSLSGIFPWKSAGLVSCLLCFYWDDHVFCLLFYQYGTLHYMVLGVLNQPCVSDVIAHLVMIYVILFVTGLSVLVSCWGFLKSLFMRLVCSTFFGDFCLVLYWPHKASGWVWRISVNHRYVFGRVTSGTIRVGFLFV